MNVLRWKDVWDSETTFLRAVKWYKTYYIEDKNIFTAYDLESYIADVKARKIKWSK